MIGRLAIKLIIPTVVLLVLSTTLTVGMVYLTAAKAIGGSAEKTLVVATESLLDQTQAWKRNRHDEILNLSKSENSIKALGQGFLAAGAKKT